MSCASVFFILLCCVHYFLFAFFSAVVAVDIWLGMMFFKTLPPLLASASGHFICLQFRVQFKAIPALRLSVSPLSVSVWLLLVFCVFFFFQPVAVSFLFLKFTLSVPLFSFLPHYLFLVWRFFYSLFVVPFFPPRVFKQKMSAN